MCEPVTITALVIGVATAAAEYSAQSSQADAQAKQNAINKGFDQTQQNQQFQQVQNQERLIGNEDEQKVDEQAKQTRASAARASVAAGEAGVSGGSVDELQRQYFGNEAGYSESVNQSETASFDRLQLQSEGIATTSASQQSTMPVPNSPNPFAIAATSLSGAGGDYGKYLYKQSQTPDELGAAPEDILG